MIQMFYLRSLTSSADIEVPFLHTMLAARQEALIVGYDREPVAIAEFREKLRRDYVILHCGRLSEIESAFFDELMQLLTRHHWDFEKHNDPFVVTLEKRPYAALLRPKR